LYEKWIEAKAAESFLKSTRQEIEDEILEKDPDTDGYKVVITKRVNQKINNDLLQELATENGLTEHLSSLFRWKPEVNAKDWKAADKKITDPLLGAITSTPGRASFKIEKIGENTK
jgi:hypothetical protein